MLSRLNDALTLLRNPLLLSNPVERARLLRSARRLPWPLLWRLACLARRTLVRRTRIVAVVGSYGKSTTMRAVTAALGRPEHRRAVFNAGTMLGYAMLRIRPWDRHAVVEAGISRRGDMALYARMVRPDVVVVTSIGSEHNRSLGTLEVTRAEKAEMLRVLPPSGLAVLNGDDPHVLWMQGQTRARVITFGSGSSNDVRASEVGIDWPNGTRLALHAGGERRELRIRLVGRHMVHPILAAVAVALAEGRTLDHILPALQELPPTPGRMEVIPLAGGAVILRDDFKSALETIETALDTLAEIPATRRIAVLGEVNEPPGPAGPIYRRLGERLAASASRAIFVGESKSWRSITRGARTRGMLRERILRAGESTRAATELLRAADLGPGDVVLIKGRSTQRLDRVSLSLLGRPVRCNISLCQAHLSCGECPMLERGWDGLPRPRAESPE